MRVLQGTLFFLQSLPHDGHSVKLILEACAQVGRSISKQRRNSRVIEIVDRSVISSVIACYLNTKIHQVRAKREPRLLILGPKFLGHVTKKPSGSIFVSKVEQFLTDNR